MELLHICLKITYFQSENKFYQQTEGIAMRKSLFPVVSNIFTEHFEEMALDTADHEPAKWLRYVDDTFVVWSHGPARLQQFLHHLNSARPTNKFTMELDVKDTLPILDVFITKGGNELATKVYRKPTHTGRYLHFKSKRTHHVKGGSFMI
jgi:hypothetical protein